MMKKNNLEIFSILFLLTNANFFLFGLHTFSLTSKKSTILAMIIASIISYLFLSLYIMTHKDKTIDIHNLYFPGKILVLTISPLILSYSLYKMNNFITENVVNSLSFYLLIISLLIMMSFALYKGIDSILHSSVIYFLTILFLTLLTYISIFPKIDFQNVLPLLDSPPLKITQSTLIYILLSLSPLWYLSYLKITWNKEQIHTIKKSFIYTQIYIIFYTLIIFSVLGISITNLYSYPEVAIFKKVSFLNIIDRMESIFSIAYFLSLFVHITMTFYGIILLLEEKVPKKKRGITLFLTSLFIFLFYNLYIPSHTLYILLFVILLFLTFTLKSIFRQKSS